MSRNRIAELRRCLAALNNSVDAGAMEVVVVDAGSRDGSAEIEGEFDAVRMIRMPRNFGKTRACNIGVRTAAGEFILFLDPAIEVDKQAVHTLARALESAPDAAAVGPAVVAPGGQRIPTTFRLPSADELAKACFADGGLEPSPDSPPQVLSADVLMVRKSFVAGMNYFDEKEFFEHYAELDLFRQIRNANKRVHLVETAVAVAHPREAPALDPASSALLVCDRLTGAAAYIGKTEGSGAAISFKLKMIFGAFAAGLRRRPPYAWRVFSGLLAGNRIDGTQGGTLA